MDDKTGSRTTRKRVPRKDVEVLASLLVAYPQLLRVTYEPSDKALSLVFLCKGPLNGRARQRFVKLYKDSVHVYLSLISQKASLVETSWEDMGSFWALQVTRDIASLSPGELSLTVDLVTGNLEVINGAEGSLDREEMEEYSSYVRAFLQEVLDKVKSLHSPRRLVALREGERVVVFDK